MKIIQIFLLLFLLLVSTLPYAKNMAHEANYYLTQASKYYNQKNYSKAEKSFQKLLSLNISLHHDFYYFYGKALYYNGHYEKAIKNLTHFTQVKNTKHQYYQEAKLLLKQAEKNLVKESLQKTSAKKLASFHIPKTVVIPPGSFTMGSLHGSSDQMPPHKIKIHKSFAITAYEITFSQYDAFVKDMSYRKPNDYGWGRGELPVINVSLHDAIVYARWLSKKTKRRFRLPTETEWEYVARTGFKDKLGFKDIMGLGDANCDGCRYFWQRERTVEVGSFEANKYGVYDLFGNVWEWTCSIYTQRYDGQESYCADEKILEGKTMAVRGGSWDSFSQLLRAYVRFNNFPTYRGNKQGFRLIEEIN